MIELINRKYYTTLLVMKAMWQHVPILIVSSEKENEEVHK